MATTLDWLDQQADRALARQRAQVETAKLVAVFSAGVSATLVATALQVGPEPRTLDHAGTWLLLVTGFAVVLVVMFDRLTEADHVAIILEGVTRGWDDARRLEELRAQTLTAEQQNDHVVRQVRMAVIAQVLIAIATAAVAALSLLR